MQYPHSLLRRSAAPLVALALTSAPALAQEPELVLRRNNPIIGNGKIVLFNQLVVNDAGLYYTDVTSDDPNNDVVILLNGFMVLAGGTSLSEPNGATLKDVVGSSMTMNNQGYVAWSLNLNGTNGSEDNQGLYWNTLLLAQKGSVPFTDNVGGFPFTTIANGGDADTTYRQFTTALLNDRNEVLMLGTLDDDGFKGQESCAALITTNGQGQLVSEEWLAVRRYPFPATGETVDNVTTSRDAWALNDNGDWIGQVQLSGRVAVIKNGAVLLRTSEESPAHPGRNLTSVANMGMNNFGDYVISEILDGEKSTNTAIVVNGMDVVVTESDSFPGLAPNQIQRFDGAPVKIADSGDVFWYASTDNQSSLRRYYFRSVKIGPGQYTHKVIAQQGVTIAAGSPISDLRTTTFAFDISDSGRFWLGEVLLANSSEALLLADFGSSVPIPGCDGVNEGSLQKVAGDPLIGGQITYEVDGPIELGYRPIMLWSTQPAVVGSPCGLRAGKQEILINPSPPQSFAKILGDPYAGAPVSYTFTLPPDPGLVDMTFYAQAHYKKAGLRGRLTNAVAMTVGAPSE